MKVRKWSLGRQSIEQRLSWREWGLGVGVVLGTLALQLNAHFGPFHAIYFWRRTGADPR